MAAFPPLTSLTPQGSGKNQLLAALQAANPVNPFAGLARSSVPAKQAAGLTLGPAPAYPGTPGPAFGVPPASVMNTAPTPPASQAAAPPTAAPATPPPAQPTQNLNIPAALQSALTQYDQTKPYQEQAVPYTPSAYTQNPKGDAISAGIQLLGAALSPRLAPGVSQNLAGEAKTKEGTYQRNLLEAQNKHTLEVAEQERLAKNSAADLAQQEKHIDALERMQEAEDRVAERKQYDAAIKERSDAYLRRVIDQKQIAGQSLSELHRFHDQQLGIQNSKIAESYWARQDMDRTALQRAGISQETATRVAGIHAQAGLALAAFNDRSKELIATNRDAALNFRTELTQADASISSLIRSAGSANISPALRAKLDELVGAGGPIDQVLQRGKALGIDSTLTPEVQGLNAVQSGVDLGALPETASSTPSAGMVNNYYGAAPGPSGYPAYPPYPPAPDGASAPSLPGTLRPEWLEQMGIAGEHYGVRPELLHRMALDESSGNPHATSPAGAQGLMQFMPPTAQQYGVNPNDPSSAITGAAHYMHDLLTKNGGSEELALVEYNGGPRAVAAWNAGRPWPESTDYVNRVLGGRVANTTKKQPTTPSPPSGGAGALTTEIAAARKLGATDDAIRPVLLKHGYSQASIDAALAGKPAAEKGTKPIPVKKAPAPPAVAYQHNTGAQESVATNAEAKELMRENPALTQQQATKLAARPNKELALGPSGNEMSQAVDAALADRKPGGQQRAVRILMQPPYSLPQAQAVRVVSLAQRKRAVESTPQVPYYGAL
jgi:hypothetical protein